MRFQSFATAALLCTSALALSACNPAKIGEKRNERPMASASRLDCPERQGDLTRTSVAADGRSCGYTGEAGEAVTLQLLALNARPARNALNELETELKQSAPQLAALSAARDANADGSTVSDDSSIDVNVGDGVDRREIRTDDDSAHINLPGIRIDADGDKARVSLPGVNIKADGGKAEVQVDKPGGKLFTVHADERGMELRTGDITAKNVDAGYLLASKDSDTDGNHAVGYVAKGPIGGPLVVGIVKGGGSHADVDDLLRPVRRLVNRNVKG